MKISRFLILSCVLMGASACSVSDWDIWRAQRLAGLSQRTRVAALGFYEKALRRLPEGAKREQVLLELGSLQIEGGDHAAAVGTLRQVSALDGQRLLALALLKNGDPTAALEVFNKIGEKGDAAYLYNYGTALEKSNLYDQALRVYSLVKGDPAIEGRAQERVKAINLISGHVAFAGVSEEVRQLIEQSPGLDQYREASALYLLIDEVITVTDDLREITDFHCVIKILNERGKESFGEVTLDYDSTYEKLDLEYARTIRPDGTVVTVGDKNIRDVSLYLNFPMYSNARVRIISMPEVASGAVIEYKGRLTRSQLPNKKDLTTVYTLATDEPILRQRCVLSVPENKELRTKVVNGEYNTEGFDMIPGVRHENGRRFYELDFRNVPQIIPEPSMPPLARVNPYILFSSFASWEEIASWWEGLYKDKIIPDEAIRGEVAALIAGKKTAAEKARALYNYCAQKIRYVAVEYGDAGYEPHHASDVFKNKYGDCKDKAILLIAMLRAAGIDAYPVLISTADALETQEDLPSILFNHAIAAVELEGKLVFMDATAMTASFGDLPPADEDRLTLVFGPGAPRLVRTPLASAQHHRLATQMKMTIRDDESVEVTREIAAQGFYQQAQRYWLQFTMPALIEEGLRQRVRSFADAGVLKDYTILHAEDLDTPVELRYAFTAPQWLIRAGADRLMGQLSGVDDGVVVKETRLYPVETPMLDSQEERLEVEFPAHLAVKYIPPAVDVDTRWFRFVSRYETAPGRLRFFSEATTKQKVVPVAEYGEYKAAVEDLSRRLKQQVVFKEVRR